MEKKKIMLRRAVYRNDTKAFFVYLNEQAMQIKFTPDIPEAWKQLYANKLTFVLKNSDITEATKLRLKVRVFFNKEGIMYEEENQQ